MTLAAGRLYIAAIQTIRVVNLATGELTTPAGINAAGPLGDGGLATKASLEAGDVAVDHAGNMVIADTDNGRIRVVAARTGTFYGVSMQARHIYTIARIGASRNGFGFPDSVAVDPAGNLLIADTADSRVMVLAVKTGTFYGVSMTAGHIYPIAGTGHAGYNGDGGPAIKAMLRHPSAAELDGNGNVLISDTHNGRIRVVAEHTGTSYGQQMTAGHIYTIAGDGRTGFSGNFGPATNAEFGVPAGVRVDAAGNVLIADSGNNNVRFVAEHTGTFYGHHRIAGNIYPLAGGGLGGFSGDGGPARRASLGSPSDIAVDSAGNVLIADFENRRIRAVAASTGTFYGQKMTAGDIYTIAGTGNDSGDGGPATRAEFLGLAQVALDRSGNELITDANRVRVLAAATGTFYGQSMIAGNVYLLAGVGGLGGFSGDGGPATQAELEQPDGLVTDSAGNVLIADSGNSRVRVVAAGTGTFYGQHMTAGNIYTIAGNGTEGFSGDGGPATGAKLGFPDGVAVDAAGNVLIADTGNFRIRVVAASTGTFYGQHMTAGNIYTVAGNGKPGFSGDGGPATSAAVDFADGVTVDAAGNLLIADTLINRIRVVAAGTGTFYGQHMTAGNIYTVAGGGTGGTGNGIPATSATLDQPPGVSVDAAGNLVLPDALHNLVRVVAEHTGTFYGVAMTAGNIYTVAGDGTAGFSGDAGPGTSAETSNPDGVAVTPAGNLLITDTNNNRIRMVTG
jgi:sugar lactone lactonase YvrE